MTHVSAPIGHRTVTIYHSILVDISVDQLEYSRDVIQNYDPFLVLILLYTHCYGVIDCSKFNLTFNDGAMLTHPGYRRWHDMADDLPLLALLARISYPTQPNCSMTYCLAVLYNRNCRIELLRRYISLNWNCRIVYRYGHSFDKAELIECFTVLKCSASVEIK